MMTSLFTRAAGGSAERSEAKGASLATTLLFALVYFFLCTAALAAGEPPLVIKSGQTQQLPTGDTLQLRNVTGSTQCIHADTTGNLTGTGADCSNVSTTGSPASGNIAKFSGATSVTNGDISGDCTTSGTLAITCLKTNGTNFGDLATQNAATPPAIGGTTPAAGHFTTVQSTSVSGSTQCIHADSSGNLTGTGSDCGIGGGGGVTGSSWSFTWQWGGVSTFTHSFACSGNLVKAQRNVTVYSAAVGLTTVSSATYKIGFAPYDTGTNKITSAPTYTATFTEGTGSANAWVIGNFGSGFSLTGGSTYIEFVCRTDSTTTVSTTLETVTSVTATTFPGFIVSGVSSANQSFHLASIAPTTSDVWTTETGWYLMDFNYGF